MTRVLICGTRNSGDYVEIAELIMGLPIGSVIIQGMCRGVDVRAKHLGLKHGFEVEDYPAKWSLHGRAAGPIRNKQMLDEGKPDIVYAFHPNISESKGTKDMVRQAKNRGIETIVVVPNIQKRESKLGEVVKEKIYFKR